jgi:hypothetical protein
MANCILRSYDAVNALKHGKEMTNVQKIIMIVSDPFAHSEFEFSSRHDNVSHSATMQGDFDGARFLPIDYSKHPERWISLILPMTNEQEDRGYNMAKVLDGMPYDTVGVTSLATGWNIIKPNPNALWCSEDVAEIIKESYGYGEDFKPDTFDPLDLFIEMYRRVAMTNTPPNKERP